MGADGAGAAGRTVVSPQADRGRPARGGGARGRVRRLPALLRGDAGRLRQLPRLPARAHRARTADRGGARRGAGPGGAGPRRRLPGRLRVRARPAARPDAARAPARGGTRRDTPVRAGGHEPGPRRHQPGRPPARRGQRLPRVRRRRKLRPAAQLLARGARRQVVPLRSGRAPGRAFHGRPVPPRRRPDVRVRRRVRRLLRRRGAPEAGSPEDRVAHERARPVQRQPGPRRRLHRCARRTRVERLPDCRRRAAPRLPAADRPRSRRADAPRAPHPRPRRRGDRVAAGARHPHADAPVRVRESRRVDDRPAGNGGGPAHDERRPAGARRRHRTLCGGGAVHRRGRLRDLRRGAGAARHLLRPRRALAGAQGEAQPRQARGHLLLQGTRQERHERGQPRGGAEPPEPAAFAARRRLHRRGAARDR